MADAARHEASLARALPYATPILGLVLYLSLPALSGAILTGGHPSGHDLGLLLAVLGFLPVLGVIGFVFALRNFRDARRVRDLFAAVVNAAMLAAPVILLAAA
jgi:hypothetical protein